MQNYTIQKITNAISQSLIFVLSLVLIAGAWPFGKRVEKEKTALETAPETVVAVDTFSATYLDSLNKGREISLAGSTLTPTVAQLVDSTGKKTIAQSLSPAFRIQCIASKQIEMIQSEKKRLESKSKLPVYILSAPPYYKLLIGDFPDRSAAQRMLSEVQAWGYADAWIVAAVPMP